MLCEDKDNKVLIKLGLTVLQSKLYLSLVRAGQSTIKSIAAKTQMDRAEVYRVVSELEKRGFVKRILTAPNEFSAIPIVDSVPNLIQKKKQEISDIETEAIGLLSRFKEEKNELSNSRDYMLSYVPKVEWENEKSKGTEIAYCVQTIDILSTMNRNQQANGVLQDEFIAAMARGVQIRVILDAPKRGLRLSNATNKLRQNALYIVRYTHNDFYAPLIIFDRKKVRIVTSGDVDFHKGSMLESNNPRLVALAQQYFDLLWKTSRVPRKKHND